MNFENMSIEELKDIAKEYNIKVGNIGKDKLIEKIKSAQDTANVISGGDDFTEDFPLENAVSETKSTNSTLDSILSAVDELEENENEFKKEEYVELPMDMQIPVRSFTFGGLIYKSPQNNSIFRWNEIGSVKYMTIGQITEMNNYNTDYLHKPYVILADERAVKHFRLTDVYENVAKINNLKELFRKDINTISKTIDEVLVVNMRDVLISKVRTMYDKKILTDINVIRLLSEKLQFDFAE